jgi:hypothetical protein
MGGYYSIQVNAIPSLPNNAGKLYFNSIKTELNVNHINCCVSRLVLSLAAIVQMSGLLAGNTVAAETTKNVAFPEKFMIRLSSYSVNSAETDVAVLSSAGIGTGISFSDDLGGENSITIPRIDAYYRFNERHRINFSSFRIERSGRKTLDIDINLGDQSFITSETVVSEIKYTLVSIGYAYSFYHSPKVELSLSAGLSATSYDLDYSLASGASAASAGVSVPLPMFGLRMAYAINSKWSVRYVSETFFFANDDALKGALLNYELDIEYKLGNNFVLGAGIARFTADLTVDDNNWDGRLSDSHRGILLYGSYYFD